MRARSIPILFLAFFCTRAEADTPYLCSALSTVIDIEEASRHFIDARTPAQRQDAVAEMTVGFAALDTTDFSASAFTDMRSTIESLLDSRRLTLDMANRGETEAALAIARTLPYREKARAFDVSYTTLNCIEPGTRLASVIAGDDREESGLPDKVGISPDASSPVSVLGLLLMAGVIAGVVLGWRYMTLRIAVRKRRAKRFVCSADVGIRSNGFLYEARLHDISQVGCKLSTRTEVKVGNRVDITVLSSEHKGRVIWANAYYAGVEFDSHLTDAQVADITEIRRKKPAPRIVGHMRPGYRSERPDERAT